MKTTKPKHIAVAGNIGAGKTTLTQQLSKHYKWIPQFEDVENNPYLNDFYEDMPRWSFQLQIYFLQSRLGQLIDIIKARKPLYRTGPSTRMRIFLRPTFTKWA
jgi:deoxyadenosine/deoxycytidine kinase